MKDSVFNQIWEGKMIFRFKFVLWVFLGCLLVIGCKEGEADPITKTGSENLSLPFLVVDLDGDGIDRIPLEKSQAFFDVDGDGYAERTEWIRLNDGFLEVIDIEEDRNLDFAYDRIMAFFTEGLKKIRQKDVNRDSHYNDLDKPKIRKQIISTTGFGIAIDYDSDGLPETKEYKMIFCKVHDFIFLNKGKATLSCKDGKQYPVQEIHFEYEDTNVRWDAVCAMASEDRKTERCK